MNCASCEHENPTGNRFCGGCGAALAKSCPTCAHPNPPDHRFCGACGGSLQVTKKERPLRDLLPLIEEARAELARLRNDAAGCERALRAAARMHRENGEEWLATQAEAKLGA